jgi:hypothetical protein
MLPKFEFPSYSTFICITLFYKIEPFPYDKYEYDLWDFFKQFKPCWLYSIQFPTLLGRNHCVLGASAGSDGRMYALFQVPLPPTIIIPHEPCNNNSST